MQLRDRFLGYGVEATASTPAELSAIIAAEIASRRKVIEERSQDRVIVSESRRAACRYSRRDKARRLHQARVRCRSICLRNSAIAHRESIAPGGPRPLRTGARNRR